MFSWKEGHFSFVILLAGFLNVTTFTIIYSYWKIYQTVKESSNNVSVNVVQNGVGAPGFHRADIDVLKSCFTVVCFFLITWGLPKLRKLSVYLFFSSSLTNPIIYGIMNPQFKKAFKKTFSCGRYGNGNADQSHTRVAAVMIQPWSNET